MSDDRTIRAIQVDAERDSGVVRALICGRRTIALRGGGCEFGDWVGFFSHEKLGGNRAEILDKRIHADSQRVEGEFDVRLPRGRYLLRFEDRVADGALLRRYELESIGPGALGDFVLRTTASAGDFPIGWIAGQAVRHHNENYMHQHEQRRCWLDGAEAGLEFELTEVNAPGRLGVYTYLRDEPGGTWVMHHRLLTEREASDEYVLRVRHSAFSSRDRAWVKPLRHAMWRICERIPGIRPTMQVGGNITTRHGERWTLASRLRVVAPSAALSKESPA